MNKGESPSLRLYREALKISRRVLGPTHPQTRTIEKNIKLLYLTDIGNFT